MNFAASWVQFPEQVSATSVTSVNSDRGCESIVVDPEFLDLGRGRKVTNFLKKQTVERNEETKKRRDLRSNGTRPTCSSLYCFRRWNEETKTKRKRFYSSQNSHQKRRRFGVAKKKKKSKRCRLSYFWDLTRGKHHFPSCIFNIQLMRDTKTYILIHECGSESPWGYVTVKLIRDRG